MRKIYDPTETFIIGVRSDYNGPAIVEEYTTSTIMDDSPFHMFYKVAKPYERWTGSLSEPRFASLTDSSGATMNFAVPESHVIIEAAMVKAQRDFSVSIHDLFSDKAYVINRAIERSQAYGDLLMLVSASEAKQTVRMLRNCFVRLFRVVLDIYNSVKKLNVVATIDMITDLWLEYRYGWTPLIGELGAIKEALTVVRPEGIKSAYATDKPNDLFRDSLEISSVFVSDTFGECVFDATIEEISEITRKAGFNYVNKPQSRNDSWSAIFGVDVDSLASTAWELIPFSFIIDMFFNFGNLLQARDVTDQVDSFNGWMTCRLNGKLRLEFSEVRSKPLLTYPNQGIIPLPEDQFLALTTCYGPFYARAATMVKHVLDWNPSYSAWNYSLDIENQLMVNISNGITTKVPTAPTAGVWTRELKMIYGKNLLSEHLRDISFEHVMYKQYIERKYCRAPEYSTSEENAVAVAYFEHMCTLIAPGEVQQNLTEALALRETGMTPHKLRDPSHRLNGYLARLMNHGKPQYGGADYYTQFVAYKIRLSRIRISDPKLLEQFNQSIDIQLLDRTLMPDFNHALTADMDLSSSQYADLTAFAFKLGNYFRNLK